MPLSSSTTLRAALVALALAVPLAACGDDGETAGTAPELAAEQSERDGTGAETSEAGGSEADETEADGSERDGGPERIVSMTASGTETLFAIGAGDDVVAVDSYSTFPADAPVTDLSAFEPNVEAIATYDPDLVLLSDDDGSTSAALEELGVEVLLLEAPTDLEGAYDQMRQIGEATGQEEEAAELVEAVEADLAEIVEGVGGSAEGLTYYYELDPTYYSVTSATFIGQLLGLLGLESIADDAQAEADDYPQLSAEFVVAEDPDLVLLADTKCCDQDAAAVAARAGWQTMSAVEGKGVVELDDDIASRWGPRIVDLLAAVAEAAERRAA